MEMVLKEKVKKVHCRKNFPIPSFLGKL